MSRRRSGSTPGCKTSRCQASDLRSLRNRARAIARQLIRLYPEARIGLDFADPFQLYVATVLSAQCTDERVNQVTPALFVRFPNPRAMSEAQREEIEELIRPTGFFRNKAKSIQLGSRQLVEAHAGTVPSTMEELLALHGIGRKTANVVLGNAFGIPGIAVDTHVRRLSQRLGLTTQQDPVKIEFDLMQLLPKKDWTLFSHLLISHGRAVCMARRPLCDRCGILKHCPYSPENNRPQQRDKTSETSEQNA